MGGKQKGARGSRMVNADVSRSRAARFANVEEQTAGTIEVPFYLVGLKHKGKHTYLNSRRNLMKAKMSLKSGFTGNGCLPGYEGAITYPLSDKENELLNSMGAYGNEEVGPAVAPAEEDD